MRTQFPGYFDPTAEQLQALWSENDSLIALDTNVLLGLYRMPTESREQVIELLTKLRERIWVPYHVVLEFHRNRLETMRGEFSAAKKFSDEGRAAYTAFKAAMSKEGVRERACWSEIDSKMKEIEEKVSELFKVTKSESHHYISPNAPDAVLSFVETLLDGRIGERPTTQAIVTHAEETGAKRYEANIGPGTRDQEKAGDKYPFDGLIYDRQYGDYMVWRELLSHSRKTDTKRLMLITSDVKPDWWLDTKSVSGKRPQPELVMEMHREAAVECFWMYTLSDFVKNARKYLHANVTQKTISDARQAEIPPRHKVISVDIQNARRNAPLSEGDIRTVLNGFASKQISANARTGYGLRRFDDDSDMGVAVVSGEALSSAPSMGKELSTSLSILGLFTNLVGLEIYVIFAAAEAEALKRSRKMVKSLISYLDLGGLRIQLHFGYFVNAERTEYVFEK